MATPVRGSDYPGSYAELLGWFPDDAACLDYLDWLRWRNGFVCPNCGGGASWKLKNDPRRCCTRCDYKISATAGTIFHRTRTPLTVWFAAAWQMTAQKNGVSALYLKRILGLGSYQTAWTMLHRYRTATVRNGRDRLRGDVEVDETVVGGVKPGPPGRGARGKTIVCVAVERYTPKGFGRCRLAIIPNATALSLRAFLLANVEPGATVITDGWGSYPSATAGTYVHVPINLNAPGAAPAHLALPGVHRVASLLKRWLLGTHHGAVERDHLDAYLDEFTFRFNRRASHARGLLFYRLLELAVLAPPRTYQSLIVNSAPKRKAPTAPNSRAVPGSLHTAIPTRPWRRARRRQTPNAKAVAGGVP